MKVTRNLPEQLIVENNPIWVALLLVGMALAFLATGCALLIFGPHPLVAVGLAAGSVVPLGLLFVFARRTQLIFEAAPGTLTWQRKSLTGGGAQIYDLATVHGAELQIDRNKAGGNMRRVALKIDGRTRPLSIFYTDVGDHEGVTRAINAWLDSQRPPA